MIGRNRTAPSAGHLFGLYTLQRPLSSQVRLVWHRCTLVWPPPVRLFAQPTNVREASRQHPAGDVDPYAHTHAHADQLWGPQYENAVPLFISLLMRTSSNASHTPHTQKHHERHTRKHHERRWASYPNGIRIVSFFYRVGTCKPTAHLQPVPSRALEI